MDAPATWAGEQRQLWAQAGRGLTAAADRCA